jgi:hypothetical protein
MKIWYRILAMDPASMKYHTVGIGTALKQQIYERTKKNICIKLI